MEVLLKMKHWHVFLLTCATMFVNVYVQISFILHFSTLNLDGFALRVLQLLDFTSGIIQLAWLYMAGTKLNERLHPQFQRPTSNFKVCLASIAIWTTMTSIPQLNFGFGFSAVLLFIILGLYIYCELFVARGLVLLENPNESVGGTFVAIFLLPVGIWWVQPRINRVFSPDWENINPDAPLDHNLGQQSQS